MGEWKTSLWDHRFFGIFGLGWSSDCFHGALASLPGALSRTWCRRCYRWGLTGKVVGFVPGFRCNWISCTKSRKMCKSVKICSKFYDLTLSYSITLENSRTLVPWSSNFSRVSYKETLKHTHRPSSNLLSCSSQIDGARDLSDLSQYVDNQHLNHMEVSINGGTPKSMVYSGTSH